MIELTLRNIRRFNDFNYSFDKKTTILVGKNSCGKSTILESIYYCCFFKSFKTTHSEELINFEHDNAYIHLKNNTDQIKVNFSNKKTSIMHNNKARLKSDVVNSFKCLIISPEQIEIINRGPSIRRDFIVKNMGQINNIYLKEQMKYNNILKQKNKLLKEDDKNDILYDSLTKQLNEINQDLVSRKINYLKDLEESANNIIKWITKKQEEISLNYKQVEVVESIVKNREYKYKTTVFGNHLDDIEILLNNISLKKFGSQGQKRTVIISLILGHMDIMYKKTGRYPLVLIDDIHAELDKNRQLKLFQLLENKTQTIIAVVDKSMIVEEITMNKNVEVLDIHIMNKK